MSDGELQGGNESWDWFDEYEIDALRREDAKRLRLASYHHRAYEHRETDPDRALALIAEGRRFAQALGEPWWVLFYDHYRVHALLHFKQDYRDVLDLAVRNALEVRKPAYVGYPRRLLIHDDLISAYTGIDPLGYADRIREALGWLDQETPAEGEDRYMLLGSQRELALELGLLAEAECWIQRTLELAARDADATRAVHFSVFTHAGLADLSFRRQDWATLAEAADLGEGLARQVGHQVELSEFLMWQSLAARRQGNEEEALRLYRQSQQHIARVRMPPQPAYFDAACAFHECGDHLAGALRMRDHELATLQNKGRLTREARCRLKRCQLLSRGGLPLGEELPAAHGAAARLKDPTVFQKALQQLEDRPATPG
jgi:hypothetical protein